MRRSRRQTASSRATKAATSTGRSYSDRKRPTVPKTLFECSSRGEFKAFWPAMKNVFAVIAGIPNQSASITTTQTAMKTLIEGTRRQHQIPYSAWNSQTSGRARPASASSE